jgi:hypothetical protein
LIRFTESDEGFYPSIQRHPIAHLAGDARKDVTSMAEPPLLSWRRLRSLRHAVQHSIDHAIYSEKLCGAGEHHVEGLCVLEGAYDGALPSCEVMPIAEVRARLEADELFWWRGDLLPGLASLRPCACGHGVLITEPPEQERLWPPTQHALERLAAIIAHIRAYEEKVSKQLAAGEISSRVRSAHANAREARERRERLQAWIPTEPELSNTMVMLVSVIEGDQQREQQRAQQRRARRWRVLALIVVGLGGWALGRTSVRTGGHRR